jgi:GH24 family phage-related lysozyme (muramidase)
MFLSEKGLELIKRFEGCRLQAYQDVAGVWTIGYGHTSGVLPGQTITQTQAEEMLKNDLMYYASCVQALIDNKTILFNVNQNMFDALTSFCYNLGKGNLLRLVKGRTVSEVAKAMLLYVNAGGKVVQGLVNRRNAERDLFLKQDFKYYTVVSGDTLGKLAKKFNYKISDLARLNDIENVNMIYVGQVLKY